MYELLLTSSAETLCHKLALIDGLNEVRPFTTKFPPHFSAGWQWEESA